jgi:hypothetical protein
MVFLHLWMAMARGDEVVVVSDGDFDIRVYVAGESLARYAGATAIIFNPSDNTDSSLAYKHGLLRKLADAWKLRASCLTPRLRRRTKPGTDVRFPWQ